MFKLAKDFLPTAQKQEPLLMDLKKDPFITSHNTKFLSFGSCFAQNLQKELKHLEFDFYFNRNICAYYTTTPLKEMLFWIANDVPHDDDELYFYNEEGTDVGCYRYFRMRCYGENAQERTLAEMYRLDDELKQNLQDTDIIIITLGTAQNGHLNRTGKQICTFFGIPPEESTINALSVTDVQTDLEEIYQHLLTIRNGKSFELFLTVSPQRYNWAWKITGLPSLVENNLSKSILRTGIHQFTEDMSSETIRYFPSFEMVVDELRLYETMSIYDHLHINQDGTPKYVVKRFLKNYCDEKLLSILPLCEDIDSAMWLTNARSAVGATLNSEHLNFAWDILFKEISEKSKEICCDKIISKSLRTISQYEGGLEMFSEYVGTFDSTMDWEKEIQSLSER
jgi:hypothetical protein